MADPPWSYSDTQKSGGTAFFGASVRYNTMNNPDCITAWGFKYKTMAFCWNKQSKNGKWISNMGRWTMGNVEICLLGVKGKPKRIVKNIKQLVIAERKRHSEKPTEVRNRIIALMGDLPRIELFARQKTEGWDVWGNEVESDIQL